MSTVGRVINLLAALIVSAAVLALFAFGYGPIPALAQVAGEGQQAILVGGRYRRERRR